ncbi:MAG: amidohydrolase family protein [Candidatus Methanomethylicia archaeon]
MKLEEYINSISIMDTHEHIVPEDERVKQEVDPFQVFLVHYLSSDLISAGLSFEDYVKLMDPRVAVLDKWKIVEPYWSKVCNTAYFESVKIAVRDLYGIDEINEDTIQNLTDKMRSLNRKGLYKWVLKDKAKIELAIHDSIIDHVDVDREFFAPVVRLEDFILIRSREDIKKISRMLNMPIHSLKELEVAIELKVKNLLDRIVGFKIALAYGRSIFFERVTFNDAEKVFNKVMSLKNTFIRYTRPDGIRVTVPDQISMEDGKDLQDYMVHKILQLAAKYSLPVQIHTGLQEGNLNLISNSNPLLLANLFMEYYDVVFDVFHGSYPYVREAAALAKNFPNVYIDMCWLHIVSPHTAREALSDWLDLVPANKILGFGGDYKFVEGAYSHAVMARRNISKVLRSKIDDGRISENEAKKIARMILRDNVLEVFRKIKV